MFIFLLRFNFIFKWDLDVKKETLSCYEVGVKICYLKSLTKEKDGIVK